MTGYNGHRSWNAWNVSLWLSNDEGLHRFVTDALSRLGKRKALALIYDAIGETRTPDGARYNITSIREAISGWE